jgi:hypothetical protein
MVVVFEESFAKVLQSDSSTFESLVVFEKLLCASGQNENGIASGSGPGSGSGTFSSDKLNDSSLRLSNLEKFKSEDALNSFAVVLKLKAPREAVSEMSQLTPSRENSQEIVTSLAHSCQLELHRNATEVASTS